MKLNKRLILTLLSIALVIPMVTTPGNQQQSVRVGSGEDASQALDPIGQSGTATPQSPDSSPLAISQDSISGTLNPARVKHSGYQVSDIVRARTDTGTNTKKNLTIDATNGWYASQAEVEVTDSRSVYLLNGTFDAGVLPWSNSTYDPSGHQTQTANYNSTYRHVGVRNDGRYLAGMYVHYHETEILWSQTVTNSPLVDRFSLSFEFLYESGPLDPTGGYFPNSYVYLIFFADSMEYPLGIDLLYQIDYRDTWYVVSGAELNLTESLSTFDFSIGLYIYSPYGNLALSPSGEYCNGDPANAKTIDIRLDNIALEGFSPPGFEEVNMTFHAGEMEAPVTGTGTTGTATITNPSFWTTDHLQTEITANASISFSYRVTLLLHRYENSSWARDPSKPGVLYTMARGESGSLTLYAYIVAAYGYENVTIDIEYPSDWENATLLDPLLNDLTSQCNLNDGVIRIPNSLLSHVGWWEVRLQCPNYAEALMVQKYHTPSGQWTEDSLFRAGNQTRVSAELGTATDTPIQGYPAQINWIMPNSTVWMEENIEAFVDGAFNGTSLWLAGDNTTAGRWALELFWTNGTEVAFAAMDFDMYHASSLTATQSVIETEAGSVITSILRYTDTDNGEYLMQTEASIVANWSSGTVNYDPNLVRSWWEADLDTSPLGGGEFVIVANASQPYFDDVTCQFTLRVFLETTLDVTSVGGTLATASYLENCTFYLSYALTSSTPIDGADITMDCTGPENGILPLSWHGLGNGNYSVSVKGIVCGLYTVTVTAAKEYHYSASDTFTLFVTEADTVLSSLNGTSSSVTIGESYRLAVQYENSSGFGLQGAEVVVTSVSPSSGLDYLGFTSVGNGDYYTYLTPTSVGTYTLTIRATLANHAQRITAFTITALEVPTVLTIDSSVATVTVDQAYSVQILLRDNQSNPITGATISVLDAPMGLLIGNPVTLPGGLYNITITPSSVGTYQITFRASLDNYLNSTVGFVLVVGYIPTSLSIKDSGLLVTMGLNEDITLYLTYEMLNGTPVEEATVALEYTGTEDGLVFVGYAGLSPGNYSFTLRAIGAGVYTVTLTGNQEYLYPATDSFTLLVVETGTALSSVNGTSGLVRMGHIFRLVIHYQNSSGGGLAGADVVLDEVSPSSGLTYGSFTYAGNGNYYTDLTPAIAGTYTIVIRASLYNHMERVVSFTLTAIEIPTVLTVSSPGASVAIDQTYTVQLSLTDDESNPVIGAIISVLNPPSGLLFLDYLSLPGGWYNITIQPLQTGTYQIAFEASCANYQYSTVGFTLVVGYIPTSLRIEGGVSSCSVLFSQSCSITVTFLRTDLEQAIEGADLALASSPVSGLTWQATNAPNGYELTFKTNNTGIWMIFITSNKTGYVDGFIQFELEVTTITSTINEISLVDDLVYGRLYNFTFNYVMHNGTGIEGASFSVSGPGADWATVVETGNGHYLATVVPEATGHYGITLVFEREGCETKPTSLSFMVVPATMSIVDVEGLNGMEGENTTLALRLIETETGEPVVGASVQFQIVTLTGPGDMTTLQETSPGTYVTTFVMPEFGTSDRIRVFVSVENYELNMDSYEAPLSPRPSETAQLGRTVRQVSPFIFVFMLGVVGLATRRVSTNMKRKRNIEALATKRRFDDMKSLIGIIVLHKDSGIPVFSRILKSGLDESLISGFIAAISQFRLEFGVDEAEWAVVPISDIIRVVKTKNLLCAFITLGAPSASQEEKLLQFAKSVGLMFDSTYDSPPSGVVDHEILGRYENLFDDLLDGHLLDDYRFAEDTKLPRSLRKVAESVSQLENPERFGLETLAREMANRGLDETTVYVKIADAIDKHYLVPLPPDDDVPSEVIGPGP